MKESNRVAASVLCFIAGGLLVFFAASHFNKSRQAVNQINNTGSSNVGFPAEVTPFVPMVWAGAGWYYGHWYNDETTYNNDVNVNRNVDRYDNNDGNAQYRRAPEDNAARDGGYGGAGGGRRG